MGDFLEKLFFIPFKDKELLTYLKDAKNQAVSTSLKKQRRIQAILNFRR